MHTRTTTPRLAELAAAARSDRNRAVDAYRAAAMAAVAIGHWSAMSVTSTDGRLVAGNALEHAPSMAWITWLFQVMPVFFVVGGFASAMSLDAHTGRGGRPEDWIAGRLRRMVAPTMVLAATWAGLLVLGLATGTAPTIALGATAAAIPLWFLANYTVDTAIAPFLLPRFRAHPARIALGGIAVFLVVEGLRLGGTPVLPQINWVLGWLLFQVAGFAWRDGLLPSGRRMVAVAAAAWSAAGLAVALGPWPLAMVHVPGLAESPTHPPSLALLLFGTAYSATAIAAAPTVTRWLERRPGAWRAVVAGNAVSMSVYLWHMTAAVAAVLILWPLGMLPTADVGTAAWWVQKLPLVLTAATALAATVAVVARHERRALLAPLRPWPGDRVGILGTAAAVSIALKLWSGGSVGVLAVGVVALSVVWLLALRPAEAVRS